MAWSVSQPDSVLGADWLQWRGPNGTNIAAAEQRIPVDWSAEKNVVWRADVPGRGHASPLVVGDLVVLETADEMSATQSVVAFSRHDGSLAWQTAISTGGLPPLHRKNTHASSTAASDGRHIFVAFCHHEKIEVAALDLTGKVVWRVVAGTFDPQAYEYGYASSPTVHGDTLIVSADSDTASWIRAFRLADGTQVWSQDRPRSLNWGSPIVASVAGRDQLLLSGSRMIAAYDPATGAPLWNTPCLTMATCGTCVWDDGLVFASGGFPDSETVAVRADGSGVVWKNRVKCYEQSLLVTGGHVYAFSDQGVFFCWDAKTGTERWKQRLGGPVSASPLLVGDLILATNEAGTTWVIRANPARYDEVARNQLGESGFASIVAVDGRLYVRTSTGDGTDRRESLYCVGQDRQP
jgi:outer membrane protein assembly factor BamB